MDKKHGGPLSVLHVSKRGIFRFGFQNLGETLLGVLLALPTGIATDFCGPNPQCGPQSHNVGTPHNAFPQDKLGLWSYPV